MNKLNEWYEWSQKTLKVLGVVFIAILIAVKVFGVTVSVPVSYEMIQEVIRADVMDPEGASHKLAKN